MTDTARQQRSLTSLLIMLLVLVLCTGQASGHIQSCKGGHSVNSVPAMSSATAAGPLESLTAPSLAFSPAVSTLINLNILLELSQSDCDLTSHLIQSSQPHDASKLPVVLILLFILTALVRNCSTLRTTRNGFPPVPQWRYRPHLHFCVFNE
ncbi:hypothetical protein CWE15_11260 [Aliidiomarina taiwanensis]|uniref:Uncharacterized protein n=1 Tax=Aliidiomarina taiwanensis TaxID=946228 RepID=A0A432WTN9_9GAMM|nr:hypothetical protein [Aliidiomarina taiwanensis]RUO37136.1 hypothetical protein CWE15_11260 [Aliidiomarina taiwanensis]